MKFLPTMAVVLTAATMSISLAACGNADVTSGASVSAPTATEQQCKDFEQAEIELQDLLTNGRKDLTVEGWHSAQKDAVSEMFAAGTSADGVVGERMQKLVDSIPATPSDMGLTSRESWTSGEAFNTEISRIQTVCEGAGTSVSLLPVVLAPEILRQK